MTRLTSMKMLYVIGCLILFAAVLLACDETVTDRAAPGDYFPLDEHSRWEYATTHTYGCCSDPGLVLRDTLHLHVEETLFWDGLFYQLKDQRTWTYKTVRKLKNQYMELPAYAPEFMFLDPTAAVGFSWTSDEIIQNKLEVTGVNLIKRINETSYKSVIEVTETRYGSLDQSPPSVFATVHYYYAKDVGLIYSKMVYGDPGEPSTIETTLLRYWKE